MDTLATICGATGAGRAALMLAMGSVMTAMMMLPCAAPELLTLGRRNFTQATSFAAGFIVVMLLAGLAGAGTELLLGHALANPLLRLALAIAAILLLIAALQHRPATHAGTLRAGLNHGRAQLPFCSAMLSAQLALGPMDLTLVTACTLWMLAITLRPSCRFSPA